MHACACVWVLGGFASGVGFTNQFFKCEVNATAVDCVDMTAGVPAELEGRIEHALLATDEFVYVSGGSSPTATTGYASIWKYHIASGTWVQVAPADERAVNERYEHVAALVTGGIVISYGAESSLGLSFFGA